jgi:hypothetical protein
MRRAAVLIAHLALSLFVFWAYLKDPGGIDSNWVARLLDLLHGTAAKPYVYRALVPTLSRATLALLGARGQAALSAWAVGGRFAARCFGDFHWDVHHAPEFMVTALWCYPFLLGFVAALRALVRELYDASPATVDFISLAALAGVPVFFVYTNYIYDFPTLCLFTLGLLLLARRRFGLYLLAFAVALFNKETIVLLVGVFALHLWRTLERRRFAALLGAQLGLFYLSRRVLNHFFARNPGEFTTVHFWDHNIQFVIVRYSLAGYLALLAVAAALAAEWAHKPRLAKQALLCTLPPLAGAAFLWGYFDELRDYYEAYPAIVLLAAPTVARLMGVELRAR